VTIADIGSYVWIGIPAVLVVVFVFVALVTQSRTPRKALDVVTERDSDPSDRQPETLRDDPDPSDSQKT